MHYLACPYCNEYYDETEYSCGGETRTNVDQSSCTDKEWADFLFIRRNTKGVLSELWFHKHGCMRWLVVERDTRTHEVLKVLPIRRFEREKAL